jgi:hypothetical protein
MTSIIRAIQPQLMGLFWTLFFLWLLVGVGRYLAPDEHKKFAARVGLIVSALVLLGFFVFVANFSVVNEVPRATIDRSATEEGKSNFQQRMKDEAKKPKSEPSTTTPTKEGEKK